MKIKNIIGIFLTILVVGSAGVFLYFHQDILQNIKNVSPQVILLLTFLILSSLFCNGLVLQQLSRPFIAHTHIFDFILLSFSASFLNLITPFRGGAGFRAWYMKKRYNLKYADYAASLFGNYVIVFLMSSIIFFVLFFSFFRSSSIISLSFVILFFLVFLLGIYFILMPNSQFSQKNSISRGLGQIAHGWNLIRLNHKLIMVLCILTGINIGLGILILFVALSVIMPSVLLINAGYMYTTSTLAVFLNITPDSIGITETFYILSSRSIGISIENVLSASVIIRAVNILVLFIAGPLSKIILLKNISRKS